MKEPARILAVDDEPTGLRLLERLLVSFGYEVITARCGEECLDQVRNNDPDLVLLDVMMPDLDGYEVVRRLKQDKATQDIPVVMVTALGYVEDRVRALEAGADDFLSKPVDRIEMRARVQSLLKVKAYYDHLRLERSKLEQEVARRTAQLERAMKTVKEVSLDTIYRLARAAEYKDEDTGAHIQRMSYYAAAIARKLGLPEEEVEHILYAAPLHDVGKIGIPDSILLKPAKLERDEWDVMRQHTVIGAVILEGSPSPIIDLARIISLTHHEKWDGSGYPRGVKGAQIPLAGRIAALADFYDAVTSRRPYKEPFTREKAVEIILEGRGVHFDPEVVDAFMAIPEEIESLQHKYRDHT